MRSETDYHQKRMIRKGHTGRSTITAKGYMRNSLNYDSAILALGLEDGELGWAVLDKAHCPSIHIEDCVVKGPHWQTNDVRAPTIWPTGILNVLVFGECLCIKLQSGRSRWASQLHLQGSCL